MDPNANLAEQEELITVLKPHKPGTVNARVSRLWDLRQALYDWLRDGGFEPDWTKAPNAAKHYGK
jgi:hypothetical protein